LIAKQNLRASVSFKEKPSIDLPMSGNTVNKLKLRNGMSYKRSDGSVIGTWNSKKQIFE
jgi:hypothetical protein